MGFHLMVEDATSGILHVSFMINEGFIDQLTGYPEIRGVSLVFNVTLYLILKTTFVFGFVYNTSPN